MRKCHVAINTLLSVLGLVLITQQWDLEMQGSAPLPELENEVWNDFKKQID